ncbi:MAG: SufE family protein [Candidatus Dadabacteria bacterium]|nr:MAG: SufE family protein [Candidatus Dadabacteria bacterium]
MTVEELVENFELFDDWEDRYGYLIDLGRQLPPYPDELRDDAHKVRGCISQVWLATEKTDDDPPKLIFRADSDAAIVKGLVAVLLVIFSNRTPQEILDTKLEPIFERLNLEQHISPNRRNGFRAMIERIRDEARKAA